EAYLQSVLEDTAAVTGLELIRRIVGVAKSFILRANQYRTGTSFVETLKEQSMHYAE
ncbi:S-methyl-5-thioribose kinase, partial [Bacillus sp. HC-Mk]